jgi:hypothetical protein
MEIQEIIIKANRLILEDEQNQNQGTAAATMARKVQLINYLLILFIHLFI